jgi:hypothetical protein
MLLAMVPLATAAEQVQPGKPQVKPISFARDIRPILSDKCLRCHGPDNNTRKANLRLDTEEGLKRAFAGGAASKSVAFQRMTAHEPGRLMPPPGSNLTLTAAQIDIVRHWVEQGARWEKHWAFVAPVRPNLPTVKNKAWSKNPIDYFILARLEKEALKPSAEASRETLIRRVTLDLTGLPPSLAEVDAFMADKTPNAYEKVVDRLLASPRFGERMVWEWLDAARYSDTNGYQEDRYRPMWPWRDWAVNALNSNMPFDQFTVEQIAGDLLPNATLSQRIATGFNRNHMLNGEGGRIPEESRVDYVADRVETTSTTWLGLTVGCAKCHDHKYDPLAQREYYQLFAYFNNIPESGGVDRNGSANPVLPLPTDEQKARIAGLKDKLTELDKQIAPLDKQDPKRTELEKQREAAKKSVDQANNEVTLAMVMEEMPKPRETHILIRGAYDKFGEKVSCGVPAVLPSLPSGIENNRLGLARWLVDPSNPLTARVAVNRYWQTLFGTGLVKTQEDFGIQGEPPSHPELLDWLATEFVRTKWDVKNILKTVVMSATYRQSSRLTPALIEKDPANRLLARGPRYRLPSFMLRDQALATSGLLVEKLGGPPVKPYQPEGVWEDFSYGKITYQQDHGEALYRRSLYTFWRRSVAPTELFDTAARRTCTVRVERTNTPLQALTMLNDVTFTEAARVLAERVMKEGGKSSEERIAYAFRLVTARRPSLREIEVLTKGYRRYLAQYGVDRAAAEKLLATGEKKRDASLDPAELAAYGATMAVILNMDEVVSKE